MRQDHKVKALENWDNEGGLQIAGLAAAFEVEQFETSEQRILAFLGASLLSLWDDLPDTARQKILNHEFIQKSYDRGTVKERLRTILR
jgi:hypothetical protein